MSALEFRERSFIWKTAILAVTLLTFTAGVFLSARLYAKQEVGIVMFTPVVDLVFSIILVGAFAHQFPYFFVFLLRKKSPLYASMRILMSIPLVVLAAYVCFFLIVPRGPTSVYMLLFFFFLNFVFLEAFPCFRRYFGITPNRALRLR